MLTLQWWNMFVRNRRIKLCNQNWYYLGKCRSLYALLYNSSSFNLSILEVFFSTEWSVIFVWRNVKIHLLVFPFHPGIVLAVLRHYPYPDSIILIGLYEIQLCNSINHSDSPILIAKLIVTASKMRIVWKHLLLVFRFLEFLNGERNEDEYTRIVSQTSSILRELESMDESRSGSGISFNQCVNM